MNIGASGFNTHGLCDESLLQLEDRIKQQLPQNRRDDFPDSLSLWVQNGREKFFQCLFNTFVNETTLAHIYLFFQKDFSGLQIAILSHIIIQTINLFLWPIFRATAITVLYRSQYSRFLLFQRRDVLYPGMRDFGAPRRPQRRRCSAENRLPWKFLLWILETTQTDIG